MKSKAILTVLSVIIAFPAFATDKHGCDYDHRVKLEITKPGDFVWDGKRLSGRKELIRKFKAIAKEEPQRGFELLPNKQAKYDTVALMLRDAQETGVRCLGFTGLERPE